MKKVNKKNIPKESSPVPKAGLPPVISKLDNEEPDFLERLGNKSVWIALGLILLIAFIVFKDYLLQEKAYLFKDWGSDTVKLIYPCNCLFSDYIREFGIPKWSFNFGMGQNLLPASLWDPFNILFYIAGKGYIMHGMIYKELAKILLSGVIFFHYLKLLKLSNYTAITGSLLFCFCSFIILGGSQWVYSNEAFEFVLLLLSFELLFLKQKWYLFPLPIFLICISQPFNLFIYGVFLAFYAVFRLFQTETFSARNAGLLFSKMMGLGIIGILLSAPYLIENIVSILESPRGSGSTSLTHMLSSRPVFAIADNLQLGTGVMRFFATNTLGNAIVFKGWTNYFEAPEFYCGLPCLLLMPQVFPALEKRVRIAFIVFISIWVLPFIFPYFRYAFWLFSGDYYRGYSFLVCFVFIYYSSLALDLIIKKRKINLVILITTLVVLFILLNYPFFSDADVLDHSIITFVSCMLLVYGVLLFFMGRQSGPAYLKYVFLAAVIFELSHLTSISANDRIALPEDEISQRKGYNDYTVDVVNYLKHTDHSFYRLDKTYSSSPDFAPSLDDAMAQDYHGTSEYSSFNQQHYVLYMQSMGLAKIGDEHDSRWTKSLIGWPILESENRVKYILTKQPLDPVYDSICDSVATFGDVKLYHNKFLLPFGFTYSSFIRESVFDSLSTTKRQFLSLAACAVQDIDVSKMQGITEFQLKDTIPLTLMTYDIYRKDIAELSRDTLTLSKFEENLIAGKTDLSEDKMMYLSVPYDGGWTLKVDGLQQDKIILNGGMTGVFLKKGQHTVEMVFDLRFFKKGLYLCLLGVLIYAGLWFYTVKYGNDRSRKKPV